MAQTNNTAPASGALVPPAIAAPSTQAEKTSAAAASPETPQELKRMALSDVLNHPCPEVQHILPGLLPGMVAAIAGPGAAGKTMLQLQVAFAFALGLPPLGGLFPPPPRPYKIALISGEETKLTLTQRLHRILDDHLENVTLDERQSIRQGVGRPAGSEDRRLSRLRGRHHPGASRRSYRDAGYPAADHRRARPGVPGDRIPSARRRREQRHQHGCSRERSRVAGQAWALPSS